MKPKPAIVDATFAILRRIARERGTISYTLLSNGIPGLPRRGPVMVATLNAVGERSWQEKAVILTVLVQKAGRNGLPSTGFYELLELFRPEDDLSDLVKAARRERERVYAAYPSA